MEGLAKKPLVKQRLESSSFDSLCISESSHSENQVYQCSFSFALTFSLSEILQGALAY